MGNSRQVQFVTRPWAANICAASCIPILCLGLVGFLPLPMAVLCCLFPTIASFVIAYTKW